MAIAPVTKIKLDAQLELRDVRLNINKAKAEMRDIQQKVKLLDSDFHNRVKRLVGEATENSAEIKDQTQTAFKFWDRLEEILVNLNVRSSEVEKDLKINQRVLESLEIEVNGKRKVRVGLVKQIATLEGTRQTMLKKNSIDSDNFTVAEEQMETKIKEKQQSYDKLEQKTQAKLDELAKGEKAFKDRAEYLSIKEADLSIYESRVRLKFEELFPGKKMLLP